jgi:ABC-type amino acid transport substrate-binding protein
MKHGQRFCHGQLAVAIAVMIASLLTACTAQQVQTSVHENAMRRVLRTGKIRCGYLVYTTYFQKDPNTGRLSGIFHDAMEEIGRRSGLKVEWVEEVGYQGIFPGLQSNRFDVFAGGLWPNASRAKAASFTSPMFYSAITAWVRADDKRFDADPVVVNSPQIKIATIDGAMEDIIAKTDFPQATRLSLPELSPFVQNLLNVLSKKADITFAEPMVVNEYLKANPGPLREIWTDKPLRIFGNCLAVKPGEDELRDFLDVGLKEIVDDGRASKILNAYEPSANTFYHVARPYAMPNNR